METDAVETDMGIGMSVLFGLLTLAGAVAMLGGGLFEPLGQVTAAAGFALAMVAAMLAVAATQLYP
jgi:hypothetical protein